MLRSTVKMFAKDSWAVTNNKVPDVKKTTLHSLPQSMAGAGREPAYASADCRVSSKIFYVTMLVRRVSVWKKEVEYCSFFLLYRTSINISAAGFLYSGHSSTEATRLATWNFFFHHRLNIFLRVNLS